MNEWIPFILIGIFNIIMFFALWHIGRLYGGEKVLTIGDKQFDVKEKDFLLTILFVYPISAGVQQLILLVMFYFLRSFLPLPYSVIILSFCFMFGHYPNIILMFAVGVMQMILLTLFSISNIWFLIPMILTHAVLATCLLKFFKADIHYGFKVLWDWLRRVE